MESLKSNIQEAFRDCVELRKLLAEKDERIAALKELLRETMKSPLYPELDQRILAALGKE